MLHEREKAEAQMLLAERDKRLAITSLAEFAKQAWPIIEPKRKFVGGWHIEAICKHLEACSRGEISNLVINMPPRCMKSSLVSVLFPAWVWIKMPEKRFLYASYAQHLSKRDSVKTRRIIESDWYRKTFDIKWKLRDDQNEKLRFSTSKEGYRVATSVGGTLTGEGGDFLVADDPHKALEVHSDNKRQNVIDWWREEMSTRSNDPMNFCKIIVMQRLHEDDLSGFVIANDDYDALILPAEYELHTRPPTSIGWIDPRTEPGELLWPARFGLKEITSLKKNLGSLAAAGQLQQRPAPAEGNIVKYNWWRWYTVKPEKFDFIGQSWDLTFKDKEQSDYVVGQVWGRKGPDKYLLDMCRQRLNFTAQLGAIQNMLQKWPLTKATWVEDSANASAVIDTLKKKIAGLVAVRADGSKIMRAQAITPQIESGNVYLPDKSIAPWIEDFVAEWAMFPNGSHDDMVDATSMALRKLSSAIVTDWLPVSITKVSNWLK